MTSYIEEAHKMLYETLQKLFERETETDREATPEEFGLETRTLWWQVVCQAIELREMQLLEHLVRAGAPLTYDGPLLPDHPWRNALEPAASSPRTDIFELLLQLGADVNHKNVGETLLHRVVRREVGGLAHGQLLLEYGADVHDADAQGQTALHKAVQRGATDFVRMLLRAGADINAADARGQTALTMAVHWRQWTVLRILLSEGIQPNANLIAKAVSLDTLSDIESTIKNVANYGLPPMVFPGDSDNKLFTAIRSGKLRRVKELLRNDRCALVRLVRHTQAQFSPLHAAVFFGAMEVAKLLIRCGANILAEDGHGCSSVDYLMLLKRPSSHMLLLFFDMKRCFLDDYMRSAVSHNRADMLRILIGLGGNSFVRLGDGRSLLEHAHSVNSGEMVDILLREGVDANERVSVEGGTGTGTLLHRTNYSRAVCLLLKYGGDINSADSQGETPLSRQCPDPRRYNISVSRHFIKMRAAGFPVSERNSAHAKNMYCSDVFVSRCEAEVAVLKREIVDPFSVSLFDILATSVHRVAQIAQNHKMFQALTAKAAQKGKFDNYAEMIQAKLTMGKTRLFFLMNGTQSLERLFPGLPLLCIENIVPFLSNEDINNCCIATRCSEPENVYNAFRGKIKGSYPKFLTNRRFLCYGN